MFPSVTAPPVAPTFDASALPPLDGAAPPPPEALPPEAAAPLTAADPRVLGQVPSAGLPALAAVAPTDPLAAREAALRQREAWLTGPNARPADPSAANVLDQLRAMDAPTRGQALSGLGQSLENMWWQNDPQLASLLAALFAGLSPEETRAMLGRMSAPAGQAFARAQRGEGLARAPQRPTYFNEGKKPGASAVPRSDKSIRDTNLPAEKVYPAHADKTKALFREAAKLAGVPESWADSPGLHNILARESGGQVGRPNYTYGSRAKDPAQWGSIHQELQRGEKRTVSSATGLGQLILPNVDRYYPAGRKGIGDPLQEAAGMLAYIKDRYGSPENAWAKYGRGHEGY